MWIWFAKFEKQNKTIEQLYIEMYHLVTAQTILRYLRIPSQ